RPEPFERVDVDLAEPIAVVNSGEFPGCMTDGVVGVAPLRQPGVAVVLVREVGRTGRDRLADQRADRLLPDVGQHADDELAAPLDHPEDRRLLLRQRPPARRPLQPPSPSGPPFVRAAAGWPLCPATTSTSSPSTAPLSATAGLRGTIPSRSWEVIT